MGRFDCWNFRGLFVHSTDAEKGREYRVRSHFFIVRNEHTRRISQTSEPLSCFAPLLNDLKARVRAAQVRAVLSVNRGIENGPR